MANTKQTARRRNTGTNKPLARKPSQNPVPKPRRKPKTLNNPKSKKTSLQTTSQQDQGDVSSLEAKDISHAFFFFSCRV